MYKRKYKKYEYENKNLAILFLYFDDCEVGNSLGSHSGQQKLGAVYLSLTCLPVHLVSKSSSVLLTTIFHSHYRNMFGNYEVFKQDILDLNKLSNEGLNLIIDGRAVTLYFSCILFLGDNLGVNQTCGFSEVFKATYY